MWLCRAEARAVLAIVAAGLDSRVTQCVANHPALSDMAGYAEKGRTGGYPHFNKYHGILKNKDCLNTLAYYDVVNFARKVKAPTYLTWGYNDNTCPPTTSYAAVEYPEMREGIAAYTNQRALDNHRHQSQADGVD